MADMILADLGADAGDRVAVMVNGLGATPAEELYILYRHVHDLLAGRRIRVHRAYVGEFATSMEMAGASLTSLAPRRRARSALGCACPFSLLLPGIGRP